MIRPRFGAAKAPIFRPSAILIRGKGSPCSRALFATSSRKTRMIAADVANIGVVFGPMDCKRLCFKGGGDFALLVLLMTW